MEYDVGALAGVTARCGLHAQDFAPLLQDEPPEGPSQSTWHRVDWCNPPALRLLAIDVEMISRRSDSLRLPVKVGLVEAILGEETAVTTVLDALVDPSASLDAMAYRGGAGGAWATLLADEAKFLSADETLFDYKERITGLGIRTLSDGAPGAISLPELQRHVQAAVDAGAFLVGHNLCSDLRALQLHGSALARRCIDTEALYPYEGGRRAPLRALVAAFRADFLPRDSRWEHFQEEGAVHEPTLDAEAALQVVLRELRLLRASPGRALCGGLALGPAPPKPGEVEQRYTVKAANVGALIGRQGATIKSIIASSGARLDLASLDAASPHAPRLLVVRGQSSECAAALLLIRGARVELTALSTTELAPAAPVMAPPPPVAPVMAPPPAYISFQPPPPAATKRPSEAAAAPMPPAKRPAAAANPFAALEAEEDDDEGEEDVGEPAVAAPPAEASPRKKKKKRAKR